MTRSDDEDRWQRWTDEVQGKWDVAAEAAGIDPWVMDQVNWDSLYEAGLSPDMAIEWAIKEHSPLH